MAARVPTWAWREGRPKDCRHLPQLEKAREQVLPGAAEGTSPAHTCIRPRETHFGL